MGPVDSTDAETAFDGGLEEFGTVSVGKRADPLVLICDPRRDLTRIADIEWLMANLSPPRAEIFKAVRL